MQSTSCQSEQTQRHTGGGVSRPGGVVGCAASMLTCILVMHNRNVSLGRTGMGSWEGGYRVLCDYHQHDQAGQQPIGCSQLPAKVSESMARGGGVRPAGGGGPTPAHIGAVLRLCSVWSSTKVWEFTSSCITAPAPLFMTSHVANLNFLVVCRLLLHAEKIRACGSRP